MTKIEQNEIRELKMRCIEAAAKAAYPHANGHAVGAQEAASLWFDWVVSSAAPFSEGVSGLL